MPRSQHARRPRSSGRARLSGSDQEAPHRELLSAVSAILTAGKINLANISLSIKVQIHEELEERVTMIRA